MFSPHLKWCRMLLRARPSAQLVVKFSTLTSGYERVHWRTQLSKIFSLFVWCKLDMISFMMSFTYTNVHMQKHTLTWKNKRNFGPSGTSLKTEFTEQTLVFVCVYVQNMGKKKWTAYVFVCVLTCQWRIILQMRPKVSLWFPSTISVPPMFTRSTWIRGQTARQTFIQNKELIMHTI